jgi:hypothetical protein
MRTYRLGPTLVVICLFFATAGFLQLRIVRAGVPECGEPSEEAQLVYYAIGFADELPDTVDQKKLRMLLGDLHRDARVVADHFEVVSYHREGWRFELRLVHINGDRFKLKNGSVAYE